MTAAVPDPRFRNQAAELLWPFGVPHRMGQEDRQRWDRVASALAEVEARVQAAGEMDWEAEAEKRLDALIAVRAERDELQAAVEPGRSVESNGRRLAWFTDDELAAELNRRRPTGTADELRAAEADVDRAARAMHETPGQPGVYGRIPWERLLEQHREAYRQMARAVLASPAPTSDGDAR